MEVMQLPMYSPDFKPAPAMDDPFWDGIHVELYFSLIGAHKAGTTWLYSCLAQHPDIFIPGEQNFFTLYQSKGSQYYNNLYKYARHNQKSGDFSNSYLLDEHLPHIFAERYPDLKLIVMCRNPVKRAFSHYLMDVTLGDVNPGQFSFYETLLHPQTYSYYDIGLYFKHIQRYLRSLKRDNLLIITMDEIHRVPEITINKVFDFLDVPRLDALSLDQRMNTWQSNHIHFHPIIKKARRIIKILFPRRTHEMLGYYYLKFVNQIADRFVRQPKPTIPQDGEMLLSTHYYEENNKLEAFIDGEILSSWNSSMKKGVT